MAGGGVGAGAARREGEWLRAYGRVEEMLPRVEALAAGRARLERVNTLQHEFWEARDVLLQADQSRRRWEVAYLDLQHSSDDRRFPELQNSDLEDLQSFVDLLDAENTEFKVQVKEVESGAENCQNAADHEHIEGDLKAALRQLKQAHDALCSEKDKEVSALIAEKDKEVSALIAQKDKEVSALITEKDKEISVLIAEKDFVREQFRTLQRDNADLSSYSNKQAAQFTEAKQELDQLQVASQKKDDEIRRLRARAKAAEAKRKLVPPEGKIQEMYRMPKEKDGEVEKRKDRKPETSQKCKKDMCETHNKNEGPALRPEETKKNSSKKMLAKDGQPQTSQKCKCVTFLSNDIEQNANDEETSNQVLEPLKKKRLPGKGEVEQDDSKAKLANGKSNGENNRPVQPSPINDALLYICSVKDSFTDKPDKFEEFKGLLHGVNSNRIDASAFICAIKVLFDGRPELILQFNTFMTS